MQEDDKSKDQEFVAVDSAIDEDGTKIIDEAKKIDATDEDLSFKADYQKAQAAIAMSYHEGDLAPIVSSIGYEKRAEAIVEMAKDLGIYVHKDPVLFNQLKQLKEGQQVPEQLFEIISAILGFSYILQGKTPSSYTREDGTKAINTQA